MSDVVLDASLFGPLIIADEAEELHDALMPLLIEGRGIVPEHWRLEVTNLGLVALRRKRLDRRELLEAMARVDAFAVRTDPATSQMSMGRTLDLALHHGLTSYDAAYLELALRLSLPLFSKDKALRKAAVDTGTRLHA